MKIRLLSAFFLCGFLFYWMLFTGIGQFCFITIAVIIWTLFELFSNIKKHKPYRPFVTIGVIGGCAILLYQTMASQFREFDALGGFVIVLVCVMIFTAEVFRKEKQNSIVNVAITIFGIFYLAYLGSYIIKIRVLPHAHMLILLLFVVTKMNDVGAYMIGSRYGKIKLASFISPLKTYEGAIGGIVVGIIAGMGLRFFLSSRLGFLTFTDVGILSLVLGVFGQLGDLFASLIKRDLGIKDFGRFLPGFGGLLDILDSMFFATPALYFYLKMVLLT